MFTCQVPKFSLPLVMGMFRDAPSMLHLTWPGMSSSPSSVWIHGADTPCTLHMTAAKYVIAECNPHTQQSCTYLHVCQKQQLNMLSHMPRLSLPSWMTCDAAEIGHIRLEKILPLGPLLTGRSPCLRAHLDLHSAANQAQHCRSQHAAVKWSRQLSGHHCHCMSSTP